MKVSKFMKKKMFPIILLILIFLAFKLILGLIPNSKNYLVYNSNNISDFKKPSSIKNCYTLNELNEENIRSCIHELNNFFINIIECAIITVFSAESTVIS
jgi:hypothetical protein